MPPERSASRRRPTRDLLADARDAVSRGAFRDARTLLEKSLADREAPEALEELGLVAWWLDDATLTFDARERAYAAYRKAGDVLGAARVAIWLVWDSLAFRGDFAVASGWLERARRILEGHHHTAEYGWLLIREGEVALFRGHDPSAAIANAREAAAIGRSLADRSVEFTALALEGLSLVSAGEVPLGMRRLDEATLAATSGEVTELHAVGLVCCWQIFACERVRDYDRAAQWCARVQEFAKRWGLSPLSAVCRTQYAGVLVWRGEWNAAEQELTRATIELARARPASTGAAVARLGELRLRQGRLDEAARLFDESRGQPIARLGRAALALQSGHAEEAEALVEQFLVSIGDGEATIRAGALELFVRVAVARGNLDAAERALVELRDIARRVATTASEASMQLAEGLVLLARGDADAASHISAAVEHFQESGAPFETARGRLELARAFAATGLHDAALREATTACRAMERLGADGEAQRAATFIRELSRQTAATEAPLTRRQVEILGLVAEGLSNPEIAKRLRLSDHTVKRHVANLMTRLDVKSRAAAAAVATKRGLL